MASVKTAFKAETYGVVYNKYAYVYIGTCVPSHFIFAYQSVILFSKSFSWKSLNSKQSSGSECN